MSPLPTPGPDTVNVLQFEWGERGYRILPPGPPVWPTETRQAWVYGSGYANGPVETYVCADPRGVIGWQTFPFAGETIVEYPDLAHDPFFDGFDTMEVNVGFASWLTPWGMTWIEPCTGDRHYYPSNWHQYLTAEGAPGDVAVARDGARRESWGTDGTITNGEVNGFTGLAVGRDMGPRTGPFFWNFEGYFHHLQPVLGIFISAGPTRPEPPPIPPPQPPPQLPPSMPECSPGQQPGTVFPGPDTSGTVPL